MDESSVSTYAGEVASLVAPKFRHEPVCVCREGFAGDKCEVMLNKCALQPCPTFKVCIPDTSAQEYSCHCPGLATNSSFFCFLFVKKSLICLKSKSMTPHWGNTFLFHSSQQLPCLHLGPLNGFLS